MLIAEMVRERNVRYREALLKWSKIRDKAWVWRSLVVVRERRGKRLGRSGEDRASQEKEKVDIWSDKLSCFTRVNCDNCCSMAKEDLGMWDSRRAILRAGIGKPETLSAKMLT